MKLTGTIVPSVISKFLSPLTVTRTCLARGYSMLFMKRELSLM